MWNTHRSRAGLLLALSFGLVGASGSSTASPPPSTGGGTTPEQDLLDVGIIVLEPDTPRSGFLASYIEPASAEVLQSEATFVSVHLQKTLQKTGRFGLVRVLPRESLVMDLQVTGQVRESVGRRLALAIEVTDATGRRWLRRRYKMKATPLLYAKRFRTRREPFQELYDEITADLIEIQARLDPDRLEDLRRIAELRYAAQLAPSVFSGYLEKDRKGRIDLERLPSRDDPMLARVRRIQVRDEYFIDLLAERYQQFYRDIDDSYYDYRANRYEVELALRNAKAQATLANARSLWSREESYFEVRRRNEQVVFFQRLAAEQAHYLEDIASTFGVVVEPMVVELDGEILRFTGTIDDQYRQWRELLVKIFQTETGFPLGEPDTIAAQDAARH